MPKNSIAGNSLRRWAGCALLAALVVAPLARAADPAADHAPRKLVRQKAPEYPQLARQRGIQGAVRIEVVIGKDGGITHTKVLGGHPLLIQAVEQALKNWKYQPGAEATTVLEFRFGQ